MDDLAELLAIVLICLCFYSCAHNEPMGCAFTATACRATK